MEGGDAVIAANVCVHVRVVHVTKVEGSRSKAENLNKVSIVWKAFTTKMVFAIKTASMPLACHH